MGKNCRVTLKGNRCIYKNQLDQQSQTEYALSSVLTPNYHLMF